MPGLLQTPLSGKAEVRLNGSIVMINGLSGTLGDGAFNGWASVDLASKPLVKLDLDFQRLDVAAAGTASPAQPRPPFARRGATRRSTLPGLNYVDAASSRFPPPNSNFGEAHFAPAAIDATLAERRAEGHCLQSRRLWRPGQWRSDRSMPRRRRRPTRCSSDLVGVRALPLLKSAADFDKLDGKLQAKIAVRSSGPASSAIMSNLAGTAFANFQDGAIRGLNVAQMIRSLTSGTLSGWQEDQRAEHRPDAALGLVPDRERQGHHWRSQSGRTAGEDDRRRHRRSRQQVAGAAGRAEARDDHAKARAAPATRSGSAFPSSSTAPGRARASIPIWPASWIIPTTPMPSCKQMGKGLFGANGALNGLGGLSGNTPGGNGAGGSKPAPIRSAASSARRSAI